MYIYTNLPHWNVCSLLFAILVYMISQLGVTAQGIYLSIHLSIYVFDGHPDRFLASCGSCIHSIIPPRGITYSANRPTDRPIQSIHPTLTPNLPFLDGQTEQPSPLAG